MKRLYSFQGLSNFFEKPRFFSLVSKGAEVIRIPRSKFRELTDQVTMDKLERYAKTYPSDEDICKDFMRENTWNIFKQDLVDILVLGSTKHAKKSPVQADSPSSSSPRGAPHSSPLPREFSLHY